MTPLLLLAALAAADRPNILWLTSEDNGPQLGCYGDEFADTPNLDALAADGLKYATCWSNAPVCAPARTTIITGMYPPSFGGQHMRSEVRLPGEIGGEVVKLFPQLLRDAGYYCTNHTKTDYNLVGDPAACWDDTSKAAHYDNRPDGTPFFAVFNETISHESKLRTRPHEAVHDPAGVRVPAYHPDTPEVRQDWAQYYDRVTEMDARLGKRLKDLEKAGLADDTIVIYFGDHGSGMPRSKRTPLDSGLRVPLIVRVPEKFAHLAPGGYAAGGTSDRLVSFVDLAPTVLSIAGVDIPAYMQGSAFAGGTPGDPPEYLFGFRGRMDERTDFSRAVTDGRMVYVRNYLPHLPHGQHVGYQFQTPTTRVWKAMYDAGELSDAQSRFWQARGGEELYNLATDPDEVRDLATPETVVPFRAALRSWQLEIRDLGFMPEGVMHRLAEEAGVTPYEYGHSDRYPLEEIMAAADSASLPGDEIGPEWIAAMAVGDGHPAARYLAASAYLAVDPAFARENRDPLLDALEDTHPEVAIAAAEALAEHAKRPRVAGIDDDRAVALSVLERYADYRNGSSFAATAALAAVDRLGRKADPIKAAVLDAPRPGPEAGRAREYVRRLQDTIAGREWSK